MNKLERVKMEEQTEPTYNVEGDPITKDKIQNRIRARMEEIAAERARKKHSGISSEEPSVWRDAGLDQLLKIQGIAYSNKESISRKEIRSQISKRAEEFQKRGRNILSLDREPGLQELYRLLKGTNEHVPTYKEAPAEIEAPTEIPKTPFFDKLKNIGKTISEFLSAPNKEADRIRRIETQSHEQLKDTFRETGKKLRGFSGFLRGVGAAIFTGNKEAILAGTRAFSAKMQENSKSQRGTRVGGAPPPATF